MSPMLVSALAGAAGGVVGAGLAWLVERILGRQPRWLPGLPVFAIGIALGVVHVLRPTFGDRLMAGIDQFPSVQALKAHYPDDYDALRAKARAFAVGGTPDDARALTAGVFATVLRRQLPKMDAESIYALQKVTRAYAGALRDVDARGCYDMMEGERAPPTLAKVRTTEMDREDMEATTRILVQTATRPAAPATPMTFDELLHMSSAALATMPERDQDVAITVLREERNPRTPEEHRIMCAFELALADEFLALGPAAGGEKMRAMQAMR
jgi:hypothetical protein